MNVPCGLVNLGNTCFLNSCVQILNQIEEISQVRGFDQNAEDSQVFTAFVELQNEMNLAHLKHACQIGQCVAVNPIHFVRTIHRVAHNKGRELFTGWAQNDLHEFLLFIIECMHNSKKRQMNIRLNGSVTNETDAMALKCYKMLKHNYENGDYSEFADLFNGVSVSRLFTPDGTRLHSTRPEIYSILDLPIPLHPLNFGNARSLNLTDCFDAFVADEILQDWENDVSGMRESVKKNIAFWNFPRVLIISLKRYSPDGKYKNAAFVDFPVDDLDLSRYVVGYKPASYKYTLFGVANHMGDVNGGHYTAYVRFSNDKWMCCNDSAVSEMSASQIVSPSAYCLFYRKRP